MASAPTGYQYGIANLANDEVMVGADPATGGGRLLDWWYPERFR